MTFDEPTLVRPAAGDVLDVYSTGGGGYGDPRLRPIDDVMADIEADLVSLEKAAEAYAVVVDPVTRRVDMRRTEERRRGADHAAAVPG
jgi:N-methylhydantoinase B